jgi:hypothetical protein
MRSVNKRRYAFILRVGIIFLRITTDILKTPIGIESECRQKRAEIEDCTNVDWHDRVDVKERKA